MVVRIYRLYRYKRIPFKELVNVSVTGNRPVFTAEQVLDVILNKFRLAPKWFWRYLVNQVKIYIVDPWYHGCIAEDFENFKKICCNVLRDFSYRTTIFDCDDFVNVMIGEISKLRYRTSINYAFGFTYIYLRRIGIGHATCFFIDAQRRYHWFEPQLCDEFNFDRYDPYPLLIVI